MAHFINNYGNMHATGLTAVIAAINTWVPLPTGFLSTVMNGFTFANGNSLVCQGAGTFLLTVVASLTAASKAQTMSLGYAINGTPVPNVLSQEYATTVGTATNLTVTDIVTLQLGDVVTIVVQNNTSPPANIPVVAASLSIARLQR